jgi:hypothetical protein
MDLLQFLGEESRKNRDAIWEQTEANRSVLIAQAAADRSLLKHTLWVVSIPLTLVLGAAGFLGWKNLTAIEHSAQKTLDLVSKQNKAAIYLEQQEGHEALEEIKNQSMATGKAEIKRVDRELQAKFSEPKVARYAIGTKRLSRHYLAVGLIEKWLGLTPPLDRFDPRSFQSWWEKNKAAYPQ